MKVLIAQFKKESNTFNYRVVRNPLYVRFGRDAELSLFYAHNEVNGFVNAAKQMGAEEVMMSVCVEYPTGGVLSEDSFRSVINSVKSDIMSFRPDVILVAMNGATVMETDDDGCGAFLEAVRKTAGKYCVIGVTLDMHANMTERIANAADIVMSYKTTPHTDLYETGKRVAELAIMTAKKQIMPYMTMVKLPLIIPAEMGATDEMPMQALMRKVIGIENRQGVYCASVITVEPWLNVKDLGCAVVVCADREETAKKCAKELALYMWSMRKDALPDLKNIEEGVALAREPKDLPILFVDSADSPSGGANGDSAEVLKGIMQHAKGLKCITNVADPAAVRYACSKGEGAEIEVALGGWAGTEGIEPVTFKGKIIKISGGLFAFKGAVMNGRTISMGSAVLLENNGIYVLVSENAVDNRDPEMYRSMGIVIEDMDIVTVKSAVGYTIPYCGLYSERVILDLPGIAKPILPAEKYDKLEQKTFPLDMEAEFSIE